VVKTYSLEQKICKTFGKQCDTALAIINAESHFDRYAINVNKDGSKDLGCWQLNDKAQKVDRSIAFDCLQATDKAYKIYQSWGNFNAWSAYKNGSYKKYLKIK
jgi:hypothetical protein